MLFDLLNEERKQKVHLRSSICELKAQLKHFEEMSEYRLQPSSDAETQTSPEKTLSQVPVCQQKQSSAVEAQPSLSEKSSPENVSQLDEESLPIQMKPIEVVILTDPLLEESLSNDSPHPSNQSLDDLFSVENKEFICKKCNKKASKKDHIKNHVLSCYKLSPKDWQCQLCKEMFTYENLSSHLRQHRNKRHGKAKHPAHEQASSEEHDKLLEIIKEKKRKMK